MGERDLPATTKSPNPRVPRVEGCAFVKLEKLIGPRGGNKKPLASTQTAQNSQTSHTKFPPPPRSPHPSHTKFLPPPPHFPPPPLPSFPSRSFSFRRQRQPPRLGTPLAQHLRQLPALRAHQQRVAGLAPDHLAAGGLGGGWSAGSPTFWAKRS